MATGRVPTTANSPLTAKGDLFTYSTAPARLAVGSNGETIVADSSTSTGLRYTAGTVQENPILNSAFQVWQRGTSFTSTGTSFYTADRWCMNSIASGRTFSRQVTNDTTNLPNIQYAMRVARNSGNSDLASMLLTQSMETVNSIPFAGKTVTFSFYARAGANYSATSNRLAIYLITGTGTDQNRSPATYTGEAYAVNNQTATLTTTWQRFTFTGNVGATATEIAAYFDFSPTGTAGANDWYEITGVQIDIGSVALPFRTYAGTIQGELAACQRYYWRNQSTTGFVVGDYYTSTRFFGAYKFPTTMRIAPSFAASGTTIATVYSNGSGRASTNIVTGDISQDFGLVEFVTAAATAGHGGHIVCSTGSSYLEWSAEL
jgi:hypothetical protein